MMARFSRTLIAFTLVASTFAVGATALDAQEMGRFRVLIPDFFPLDGANKNFGQKLAEELREAMNELPTHQPIDKDEIEDDLDRVKMKMDQLNCVTTRQLGAQMNAEVAVCASYDEVGDERRLSRIEVWDLGSNESLEIEGFTVHKDAQEEAADRIVQAFDRYVQQIRFVQFCGEYAQSQQWENALRNCQQALELNPMSETTLHQTARILYEMERLDESLAMLEKVLEVNPYRDNSLQLAGYVATQLDDRERGREYYGRYLELNPGDVAVRRRIAYEIFEAGDPEGAMLFIRDGLEVEENPDLLQDYGRYAFAAAAEQGGDGQGEAEITSDVADLYGEAIQAYLKVFEAKGEEMEGAHLANVIRAHIRLGQVDRAIVVSEQVLEAHPQDATLWNTYSTALQRDGRIDDAIAALDNVHRIDPEFPQVRARQGNLLLEARRFEEALPLLQQAVADGEDPDRIARMIFADAHRNGVQPNDYDYAIVRLEAAREFEVSSEQKEELDFWLGYSLYSQAVKRQEPNTLATAQATLPVFQRARRLFEAAVPYGRRQSGVNVQGFLQNTDTYIEIQEAIIKRGG